VFLSEGRIDVRHRTLHSLLIAAALAWPASARAAEGAPSVSPPTTTQCLSASEAAIKLRRDHALRDARVQLLVCASASCPADVRAECTRLVDEVGAAIPTIVFALKDAAGNDVPGVRVTVDGKPIEEREGVAIALDPGPHSFLFEAAGRPSAERTFVLREGEKDRRERIIVGRAEPAAEAGGGGAGVAGTGAPSSGGGEGTTAPRGSAAGTNGGIGVPPGAATASDQPRAGGTAWGTQRVASVVVAGAGAVGVVVGLGFGLAASSAWSRSKEACDSAASCQDHSRAVSEHDSAVEAALASTLAFGAGAALLGAGALLWFTAPPRGSSDGSAGAARLRVLPSIDRASRGVLVERSF